MASDSDDSVGGRSDKSDMFSGVSGLGGDTKAVQEGGAAAPQSPSASPAAMLPPASPPYTGRELFRVAFYMQSRVCMARVCRAYHL